MVARSAATRELQAHVLELLSPLGPARAQRMFGGVGLYVGEDAHAFHVLGGNQSDRVMIKRITKNRLLGCRRCPWRINQPAAVRPVVLAANGALSTNEA